MKTLQVKKLKKSIRYGDVIQLGEHKLLCGDATDKSLISKFLGNEQIQLILTDPPYGVGYVEGKRSFLDQIEHDVIENDHVQTDTEYLNFTLSWVDAVKSSLAEKNSFYVFNTDKKLFALQKALTSSGFKFSQLLVWVKTSAVIGRLDYLPQHELIAYGWLGKHEFMKHQDKSVLICPKTKKNGLHPTMKPVSLLRRLILNSSKINDFVYDPFGGSGSTLLACEQVKRQCLMIELKPKYCDVIYQRFRTLTGIEPNFLTNLA